MCSAQTTTLPWSASVGRARGQRSQPREAVRDEGESMRRLDRRRARWLQCCPAWPAPNRRRRRRRRRRSPGFPRRPTRRSGSRSSAAPRAAGEELGYDILYVGVQEQTNIAGQVNLVNDMVVRKVAGILIAATDAKALAPAVEQAIERGVPVITLDSGVDSDKPYAYIATDNIGAARIAARDARGADRRQGQGRRHRHHRGLADRAGTRAGLPRGHEGIPRSRGARRCNTPGAIPRSR